METPRGRKQIHERTAATIVTPLLSWGCANHQTRVFGTVLRYLETRGEARKRMYKKIGLTVLLALAKA